MLFGVLVGAREAILEVVWLTSLTVLWGVVLVNLLLTLRVVRWLRSIHDSQKLAAEMENLPEITVGEEAPPFRAKTLSGEETRLSDYADRATLFIFVSPRCELCRQEMQMLVDLSTSTKAPEPILVSDQGTSETFSWINEIREKDKVDVNLQVLISSYGTSGFQRAYNPRGLMPYFCFIDEQGVAQARGPVGANEWNTLKKNWGIQPPKPSRQSAARYR